MEPNNDATKEMGDPNWEMSKVEKKLIEIKQHSAEAFSSGDYQNAVDGFIEAIKLDPKSAHVFSKRANCFLDLNKPNEAIRDCNESIELNPDSGAAHKLRGRAHMLLGNWEDAVKDLRLACEIDYDDEANEWLKEVTPNAKKLEEHRMDCERKRQESQQPREDQQATRSGPASNHPVDLNSKDGLAALDILENDRGVRECFNRDPELKEALEDPEVLEVFKGSIPIRTDNPNMMTVIKKMVIPSLDVALDIANEMPAGNEKLVKSTQFYRTLMKDPQSMLYVMAQIMDPEVQEAISKGLPSDSPGGRKLAASARNISSRLRSMMPDDTAGGSTP